MAVVIEPENKEEFLRLAAAENLKACPVAVVTEDPRLVMKWNGKGDSQRQPRIFEFQRRRKAR